MTTDATAKVARNLAEILELVDDLHAQAIAKSNDQLMPGGLATVALGPVANPQTWANQLDAIETAAWNTSRDYGIDIDTLWPETYDDPDWEHPLQTLLYWSLPWRKLHGYPPRPHPTVKSETTFITWALDWAHEHEPRFQHFTRDITKARTRLENLLYAGNRADRVRVTCNRDYCPTKPQLIVTHAPTYVTGWRCPDCGHETPESYLCDKGHLTPPGGRGCPRMIGRKDRRRPCNASRHLTNQPGPCDCGTEHQPEPLLASDATDDGWKCPACKHRYDADELRAAFQDQLRSEGNQIYLPLAVAIHVLRGQGRAIRTIRQWLEPPAHVADRCLDCHAEWDPDEHPACPRTIEADRLGEPDTTCGGLLTPVHTGPIVQAYCDLTTHHVHVWWPDLWSLHNRTRTTTRKKASA